MLKQLATRRIYAAHWINTINQYAKSLSWIRNPRLTQSWRVFCRVEPFISSKRPSLNFLFSERPLHSESQDMSDRPTIRRIFTQPQEILRWEEGLLPGDLQDAFSFQIPDHLPGTFHSQGELLHARLSTHVNLHWELVGTGSKTTKKPLSKEYQAHQSTNFQS